MSRRGARMLPIVLAALLASTRGSEAQDEAKKIRDPFWGYELAVPGLKKVLALGDPALVYRGKAGDLKISLRVHETEQARSAKQWLEQAAGKQRPGAQDKTTGPSWLAYTQKSLAGFDEHHGHAFYTRGHQCFELHVSVERADGAEAIRAVFRAFQLDANAPGTLLVARVARERGLRVDDPRVLLRAGVEYVTGKGYRLRCAPLGARVLAQARAALDKDKETYKPEDVWVLYEFGGLAHADTPAVAADWHARAEKEAPDAERRRRSAYNLACVCSLAKRIDDAFAALHRAYEGGKPVTDAHVSGDKDLENCRRDQQRWDGFWRTCVAGR